MLIIVIINVNDLDLDSVIQCLYLINNLQESLINLFYLYVTGWGKFGRVSCKQTNVAACRFKNECNKVEIALRVMQFWSELKLVITRLISDQIALHSVQLPLLISFFVTVISYFVTGIVFVPLYLLLSDAEGSMMK